MSVDRKEIDLIIRAAVQGGKTLESVTKSIESIEKAIDAQSAAAKRGESSIDDLKASLLALQRAQDQLKDQAGLIGQFSKLTNQIAEQIKKVESSSKAYADYKDKLDKLGTATEFQANKLIKLANATERNQATLVRQRADQEALTTTLAQAGVETTNLAAAEDSARKSAAQLGLSINKVHSAIATYSDDLKAARTAEAQRAATAKKAADEAAAIADAENRRLSEQRAFRQAITTQKLSEIKATEDEVDARKKAAAAAEMQARGYKTLATAAKSLGGSQTSLRDVISGITDPSSQARSTLAGVEQEITKVAAAVRNAKGPVTEYSGQMRSLEMSVKALQNQASLVDQFSKQVAVLRSTRLEFSQARAQVLQYADALKNSTGENDKLQASLRQAQGVLASAQKNLASQLATTRELRTSMQQAGLATNDLAATQSRLTSSAKTANSAIEQLGAAKKKYGESVREAASAENLFTSNGRTTLSYIQRLRGEVLSLIAAYAGIYAAVEGATKVLDAFKDRQATLNKLSLVGDKTAEYAYITGQSDRIGLDLKNSTEGYSKFAVAAKLAGRQVEETRYIFESFAETGTVLNLSGEKMERVFYALEQMMSKGKIQSEELRGQLGDVLPGAFGIFQQALKDKFPDLEKAMKDGKVAVSELITVAQEYRKLMADQLPTAMQSMQAEQNRFNSELTKFKLLVADAGFADAYVNLLRTLTTFFKSEDGVKFAKALSEGLVSVADGLALLIKHSETVKTVLVTGLLLVAAKAAGALALAVVSLPAKIAAIGAAAATATPFVVRLNAAFMALNGLAIGFTAGTLLREFEVIQKWAIGLVYLFETTWTTMKYGAKIVWEEIPALFADGFSKLVNIMTTNVRQLLGLFSSAAKALGKDDLGAALDATINSMVLQTNRLGNASASLRKELSAELAKIKSISVQMMKDVGKTFPDGSPVSAASPTAKPTVTSGVTKPDEKEGAARIKAKQEIENALAALEVKIGKDEKDNLDGRLKAIYDSYSELRQKILALGGTGSKEMMSRLNGLVADLQIQEIDRFNTDLEKQQEGAQTRLEQMEAAAGRKRTTELQARLDAVQLQYTDHYRELEKLRELFVQNGRDTGPLDETKVKMDSAVAGLKDIETQKFYEESINLILEERKAKLDTINAQVKAGLLTSFEGNQQATAVIDQIQPKLEAATAEGMKYVETMLAAAEATGGNVTALELLRTKLIEATASNQGLNKQSQITNQLNESLASGATTAISSLAESFAGLATGTKTWGEAIKDTRNTFLKFAADFMLQIAQMIIKQMIMNALQSASKSGGWVGAIASAVVGTKHTGGIVGTGSRGRRVDPSMFIGAPRYHGGGVPGLAPGEYATILKKNEEVLTDTSPRNILNGGAAAGGAQGKPQDVSIANYVDAMSFMQAATGTAAGRKVIMNVLTAERSALRALVGN